MGIADERTEGLQILVGPKFGKDAEAWGKATSTRTDYVSTRSISIAHIHIVTIYCLKQDLLSRRMLLGSQRRFHRIVR
jgi:hypothetical protein